MKLSNQFFITSIFILSLSCGKNAYIKDPTTQITETLTEEELEIRFYTGDATSGLNGHQSTQFSSELAGDGSKYLEDFTSTPLGKALEVKGSKGDIAYRISHLDDSVEQKERNIYIESPVSQGGAQGEGVGLDFAFGSNTNKNTMLISFNRPIAHFGVDLIDFESSSNFTLGKIIAKDCSTVPKSIVNKSIDFGNEDGNSEVHFFGLVSNKATICSVQIFIGDDATGSGKSEKFAIDNIRFGTSLLK